MVCCRIADVWISYGPGTVRLLPRIGTMNPSSLWRDCFVDLYGSMSGDERIHNRPCYMHIYIYIVYIYRYIYIYIFMWIWYQCLTDGSPRYKASHLLKLIPFCEDSFLKVAGEQEDWSVAMESRAPWEILKSVFLGDILANYTPIKNSLYMFNKLILQLT